MGTLRFLPDDDMSIKPINASQHEYMLSTFQIPQGNINT
jgi:hypothetical protein